MTLYILNEKLTSTIAVYMIIKRVILPWEKWKAFHNGIIDNKGRRLKRPTSAKEREGWDILDRFCWSIKRLCTKYIGDSTFAYLFSASYLMKENAAYVISQNFDLYKNELDDFNTTKQKHLYDCFQELELNNLICESHLGLETNILKIINTARPIIEKYLIEDDVAVVGSSTALGDVSQFTPMLGMSNKKKLKRKSVLRRKLSLNNTN